MPDESRIPKLRTDRSVFTTSVICSDGRIGEMVISEGRSLFLVYDNGELSLQSAVEDADETRTLPLPPSNNLVTHRVVLFPSAATGYDSVTALIEEVRNFIHHYVDLSPEFEELAAVYVMLTWIYDSFPELPYLRVRGDYGSGKSRFLLAVGAICYKPIFASGSATVSPLFRLLDSLRGSLVLDESDFRYSDEKADIVKILNNGTASGFPVLRSESTTGRDFTPRAFHVFGPKLIATRSRFSDEALESRCITGEMGTSAVRREIPRSLPSEFWVEAELLRNKLLMYRFLNYNNKHNLKFADLETLDARSSQLFAPLFAVAPSNQVRQQLLATAQRRAAVFLAERGMSMEAQLLIAIRAVMGKNSAVTIGDIAQQANRGLASDLRAPLSPRKVGALIRNRLGLSPVKSNGVYILSPDDAPKLAFLFRKYDIDDQAA